MDDLRVKVHEAVDVLVDFLHGVVAQVEGTPAEQNQAEPPEVEDEVQATVPVESPEVPDSVANTPVGTAPVPPQDPNPVTPAPDPIAVAPEVTSNAA